MSGTTGTNARMGKTKLRARKTRASCFRLFHLASLRIAVDHPCHRSLLLSGQPRHVVELHMLISRLTDILFSKMQTQQSAGFDVLEIANSMTPKQLAGTEAGCETSATLIPAQRGLQCSVVVGGRWSAAVVWAGVEGTAFGQAYDARAPARHGVKETPRQRYYNSFGPLSPRSGCDTLGDTLTLTLTSRPGPPSLRYARNRRQQPCRPASRSLRRSQELCSSPSPRRQIHSENPFSRSCESTSPRRLSHEASPR